MTTMTTTTNAAAAALYATPRRVTSLEDCHFYHTMQVPGHGLVKGEEWDLRMSTRPYLGHTNFAGQRVLEVGPASGYLSFYMEQQGASVVSLDVDPGFAFDVVPFPGADRKAIRDFYVRRAYRGQNAYWFAHQRHRSRNQVHYGSAYAIPAALGSFDIGLVACVLLHNSNPAAIIDQVAQRVTRRLILVDIHHPPIAGDTRPLMQLVPSAENQIGHTWWRFSEAFFVEMLKIVGFSRIITTHSIQYWRGHAMTAFTVVGER
jgi:O-methyltransferase